MCHWIIGSMIVLLITYIAIFQPNLACWTWKEKQNGRLGIKRKVLCKRQQSRLTLIMPTNWLKNTNSFIYYCQYKFAFSLHSYNKLYKKQNIYFLYLNTFMCKIIILLFINYWEIKCFATMYNFAVFIAFINIWTNFWCNVIIHGPD